MEATIDFDFSLCVNFCILSIHQLGASDSIFDMDPKLVTPELIQKWTCRTPPEPVNTLSDIDLSYHCPLDNGRHAFEPSQPAGGFSKLPVELVANIFLQLDLLTITSFRQVNKQARLLVDAIPQYGLLYQACPGILRAVISVQARFFDLKKLYETVCCVTKCSECPAFGGYLYLITCERVCYCCFTSRENLRPAIEREAMGGNHRTRKSLMQFPNIRAVAGRYGPRALLQRDRRSIWHRPPIRLKVSRRPFSVFSPLNFQEGETRRYMAVVAAPYFDLPCKIPKLGLYCLGCELGVTSPPQKQYTKQGYVEHLSFFGEVLVVKDKKAANGWKASHRQKRLVAWPAWTHDVEATELQA